MIDGDSELIRTAKGSYVRWSVPLGLNACPALVTELSQLYNWYALRVIVDHELIDFRMAYRRWLAGPGRFRRISLWDLDPGTHRIESPGIRFRAVAWNHAVLGGPVGSDFCQHGRQ